MSPRSTRLTLTILELCLLGSWAARRISASPPPPARSFLGFPGLLGFPGSLCFRGAGGLGDGLLADGFSPREFDSRSRPSALLVSSVFPVLLVFLLLSVFEVGVGAGGLGESRWVLP